jgi:hypothetical protein
MTVEEFITSQASTPSNFKRINSFSYSINSQCMFTFKTPVKNLKKNY